MSKEHLLLWHIGLGDALICNGLVRELHARLGRLTLPALPKYQKSIEWMFGDLPGVTVLPLLGFDEAADDLGLKRRHIDAVVDVTNYNNIAIGLLSGSALWRGRRTIDNGFYDQAGVPFAFKWSKFFHRKYPAQIVPPGEPYVFVHMDAERKYVFEPQYAAKVPHVVTNLDWDVDNLFRLQEVLERAEEIHVMESVFSNWIELMPDFRHRPMYLYDAKHMYGGPGFPVYRHKPWTVVACPCPTRGMRLNVRGTGNSASLATSESAQGTIVITIERAQTPVLWDIQLRKPGLPLEEGVVYELSFRARAHAPHEIAYGINDHDFRDLGLFARVWLGPAWQEFRQTLVPRASDTDADLHFDLGGSAGSLEFADISLRRLPDRTAVEADPPFGCACWPAPEPDE